MMERESIAERLHEYPPEASMTIASLIKIIDGIGDDFSGYGARLYVQQQINAAIDGDEL